MDSGRDSGNGRASHYTNPYFSNRHSPAFEPQAPVPPHPCASENIRPVQVVKREPISRDTLQLVQHGTPALARPAATAPGFQSPPRQAVQAPALTLTTPSGAEAGLPSFPQGPHQLGYQPTALGLPSVMSPWARGIPNATLPPRYGAPSHDFNMPINIPPVVKDIDDVALPSEIPIGSDVHLRSPPGYGVIKIANIPYSITKQEIVQFIGRHSRLITRDQGCAIHIIMERSTAKTMDCYAEFDTKADALEAVNRINRICETGRAPRLGNRHVDVGVSSQDALLEDLFPRAKCVVWSNGVPSVVTNTDPYSSGFTGFFTGEEIYNAIRHAEMPQRSPFSAKCPQRTYESTISTVAKFPWFATGLYTVHDRNTLFNLVNRQIMALTARINSPKRTMGLDQKLLRDLLHAGLTCPAFNGRMKFTLSWNAEIEQEIARFDGLGTYFPFDTLVKLPSYDQFTYEYYVYLLSMARFQSRESPGLPNSHPLDKPYLRSPYGKIWFEWPSETAKSKIFEDAVQQEMVILCNLVLSGWMEADQVRKDTLEYLESVRKDFPVVPAGPVGSPTGGNENIPPHAARNHHVEQSGPNWVPQTSRPLGDVHETPSRRAGNGHAEKPGPSWVPQTNRRLGDVHETPSRHAGDGHVSARYYETPRHETPHDIGEQRSFTESRAGPFRRGGDTRMLAGIYGTPSRRGSPITAPRHRLDPFSGVSSPVAEDNSAPWRPTRPPSGLRGGGSDGYHNALSSSNWRSSMKK